MAYANKTLATYKGLRTYKKKDGTEGVEYLFADEDNRIYPMYVADGVNDIPVDSKVIAHQLHSKRWNKETKKFDIKILYKSVELAVIKN